MKLVLFINSLTGGGGAERALSKLANHWATTGHEITLVTLAPAAPGDYELAASVTRISLRASGVSKNPFHALANNFLRIVRLRDVLKQIRPDCVIAFMTTANVIAICAAIGTRIPVIGSERTHLHNAGLALSRQFSQRITYPHVTDIVTLTEDSAAWIRTNLKCDVTVIPNSICLPLPRTEPIKLPRDSLDPATKVVLCVGRLVKEKQMAHLIEAFTAADSKSQSGDTWVLVIVGAGEEEPDLLRLVDRLDIQAKFLLVQQVGNVQEWYERADIYAMTSQHEGFPNALLEGLACGCPAIAYDCATGPAELIDDRVNGFLVPLYDQEQYCEQLVLLMDDPDKRAQFGNAAKNLADQYSDGKTFAAWTTTVQLAINS
jgi:glycosyltransferase involved in cell wall biosynthesis